MFTFDEKKFFTPKPAEPTCPPMVHGQTFPEKVEYTSRMLRDTLERLQMFEKTMQDKYNDLMSIMTQDNVVFKELMQEAYTEFVSSVRSEINLFEVNTDSVVALFKQAINARLDEFNANHSEAFADYQGHINAMMENFEDDIRNAWQTVNAELTQRYEVFEAEVNERMTAQDAKLSDAEMYMKTNMNASVENLLHDMQTDGTLVGIIDSSIIASVRQKGASGDGIVDDTAVIQNVINNNRNVLIDNGTFLVSGSIVIPSDTVVTIRNAKILSNSVTNKDTIFMLSKVANVRIYGENATLEMAKPATAQQACIQIADSQNVIIDGLSLKKAGGDGLLVGGSASNIVRDVEISNCLIDNNRRNGVSFIGGIDGLRLHDCVIKNTGGTSPEIGIDFETWDINLFNKNIQVYNCRFENNGNGALTIFENTQLVEVYNNYFDNNVSVKVNNDYTDIAEACPTGIVFHDNTFNGTFYVYRILHGTLTVKGNTFNGGQFYAEHTVNVHATKAKEAGAKLIASNVFNRCNVAISVGNNAAMLIEGNVANDCNVFFDAYGFFDSVVCNNLVNGYNRSLDKTYVFHFNGIVNNVKVEGNTVQQNGSENSVSHVVFFQGGSATDCVVENNNFAGAVFGAAVSFNAQADNLARNNKTPVYAGIAESLPVASAKFVGVIVTYLRENQPVVMVCKPSGTGFEWAEI